jgi:hypothetical protein
LSCFELFLYSGFALEWKRIWLFQSWRGGLYGGKKDQEACYLDTDFGKDFILNNSFSWLRVNELLVG